MYSDESVVQRLANCSNYFNLFPNVANIKVKAYFDVTRPLLMAIKMWRPEIFK